MLGGRRSRVADFLIVSALEEPDAQRGRGHVRIGFFRNTNNCPFTLARAIRALGHDVVFVVETLMATVADLGVGQSAVVFSASREHSGKSRHRALLTGFSDNASVFETRANNTLRGNATPISGTITTITGN